MIEVTLDRQANVQLLDASNFSRYRRGEGHRYEGGGLVKRSPFRMRPPSSGHWYVVIDLGGGGGTIRSGVRVLRN